jgi:tRNA A-37 threonylcarbamoyl transferase component Bud32
LDATTLQADATIADASIVAAVEPADGLTGRVLDDKYRLDARLGEGGMGTVYRATHLLIDRQVAVKVLNHRFVEDEAAQARFRREARAAGRLQHPNVAAVTDFGRTADGLVYLVMELLEGRSLRELLTTEAPLEIARAASLMLQVAAAVGAAHEAGVIHRDLKPGNIFIVQRRSLAPVVKVLDFGIAKLAAEAADDAETHALTQTGVMIGTPRYMSPEQCDGARLSPASDVYSLGIILYEMLTGETPFNGPTPLAVAVQHSSKPPRRPRELRPSIPTVLEELLLRALAKDPTARPADAGVFRAELYAAVQRLGLEHAAEFSAPTSEMLREAGTETPSGRLVLDLERLRAQRAARPRETTVLAEPSGAAQRPTGAEQHATSATRHATAETGRATGEVALAPAPANGRARPFTRLRILIEQRKKQHQIRRVAPLALAGTFVVLMLLVGAAALRRPGLSQEQPSVQADGPPQPVPTPTPEPTPEPTPTPDARARKREEKKPAPRPTPKKKESTVGKVVKGIKKILKNPF